MQGFERIRLSRQIDKKRAKSAFLKRCREKIEDFEEERVLKIVGDEADEFCPVCRQASGDEAGLIAEIAGRSLHFLAGFIGDAGALRKGSRDGGPGNAGAFCNFF